ncbi:bifunctional phosphopantothenoylcysteine decarboxylase/phosphopantothenate--cysteine ligase CoaBC [Eisenibacter elegans]|uniref:bifunctional phosphopantothenoylcysteine decarboxylase/phosphopantothenate--cysteine ligase CoaBC n=1 Tax=Eisenibacter elegans TaxID=997 RepID=UPI0003FC4B10|nr:bifunctional phosphopantothenoylcysteine decarboxylase/phosphopantothenate--cysteine ligase CoaBC [Eisenibacter elegans]
MGALQGKKIILAVTASIAAYKSAMLVRLLVKAGAEVQVLMSQAATTFITPLTLSTLSNRPVLVDFVKDNTGVWNNHVDLGLWADAMVFAPASANSLAKCAHGLSDNLLIATYLSARCPVFFAPAMDLDMYQHPATRESLQRLQGFGNHIIAATHGELASGLVGEGRMAEPEAIVAHLEAFWAASLPLQGLQAIVTAGPTYEAIDPVRFIGNHSTGKMGFAIAQSLARYGARVQLVSGPTALPTPSHTHLQLTRVQSAQEMYEAVSQYDTQSQIIVLSAAVADYRPAAVATQKIKKNDADMSIPLVRTIDIAQTLGQRKRPEQTLVGFALETEQELANAQGKLQRKNLDLIVLNSMNDPGAGFGHNTNLVTLINRQGTIQPLPLMDKAEVANHIVQAIIALRSPKANPEQLS